MIFVTNEIPQGATQSIQRKTSKQVTEMIREFLTKLHEMCFNNVADMNLSFFITYEILRV